MSGDYSGSTGFCQSGTWRSGAESPAFPGTSDARRLLGAIGRTVDSCTLVRVRLAARDQETLLCVRERLLGEEPIVATSIGREAGPPRAGTFDMLVVPNYDPVIVGRAVATAEDVVGVAATTFETTGCAGAIDEGQTDDDPSDVGEALAEPEASDAGSPYDESVDELTDTALDGVENNVGVDPPLESGTESEAPAGGPDDDPAFIRDAPAVDGLDALEEATTGDGSRESANPMIDGPGRRSAPNTDGGTTGDGERAEVLGRLEALETKVAELETGVDESPDSGHVDSPSGPPADDREALVERVEAIEATVADLERWQRRMREALLDGSS